MLKPLPMTALYLGYAALAGYARPTSAISQEAYQVCCAAHQVLSERERSESLFGQKALLFSSLAAAINTLAIDDDQAEVTLTTASNARRMLRSLPDDLLLPNIGIDPDGAVSLTWVVSRSRMFSVSVGESERMAFAWMNGSHRGHAVARFRMPELPEEFLSILRSIVSHASPAFGTF